MNMIALFIFFSLFMTLHASCFHPMDPNPFIPYYLFINGRDTYYSYSVTVNGTEVNGQSTDSFVLIQLQGLPRITIVLRCGLMQHPSLVVNMRYYKYRYVDNTCTLLTSCPAETSTPSLSPSLTLSPTPTLHQSPTLTSTWTSTRTTTPTHTTTLTSTPTPTSTTTSTATLTSTLIFTTDPTNNSDKNLYLLFLLLLLPLISLICLSVYLIFAIIARKASSSVYSVHPHSGSHPSMHDLSISTPSSTSIPMSTLPSEEV